MKKNYKKYYIGVDVGGTTIKFGVFGQNNNEEKEFLKSFSIDTVVRNKDSEKAITNDILNTIEELCENNTVGLNKNKLKGIGITIPGPVVNNTIIKAVNINWKKKYDVVLAIKKRFGQNIKVLILNDGNAAALGEYRYGLKSKYNSVCLLTLGTAVGTGIIINNKLVEGKNGIAGEISHFVFDNSKEALKCKCGNLGCLETVASGTGIVNLYKRLYHKPVSEAKTVIDLAKSGDKEALCALELSFDYLSSAIYMLILVCDPDVVLIGGGVSSGGKFIIDIIKKHLKGKLYMIKKLPIIKIAKLKNKAGMYGIVADL